MPLVEPLLVAASLPSLADNFADNIAPSFLGTRYNTEYSVLLGRYMKLTGSLKNNPFDEILLLLMQQSGTLTIWDLPDGRGLQMHLSDAKLTAFFINYKPIKNDDHIVRTVAQLLNAVQGVFDFQPRADATLEHSITVDINGLLLNAATLADETKLAGADLSDEALQASIEQRRREDLVGMARKLKKAFPSIQGIVISSVNKPIRLGDAAQATDANTLRNTAKVTRDTLTSPAGELDETIIRTPDVVIVAYRFGEQKALFALETFDDALQHEVRAFAGKVADFWAHEPKLSQ